MTSATKSSAAKSNGAKTNKPAHEIRLGRIKAAIWANSTDNGTRYNVTFTRLYRDDEGWKDSSSFGRDDLPLLAKVADQAHTWIFEQSASQGSSQSAGDDQIPY